MADVPVAPLAADVPIAEVPLGEPDASPLIDPIVESEFADAITALENLDLGSPEESGDEPGSAAAGE